MSVREMNSKEAMSVKLKKWSEENKKDLIRICNSVDRKYLSGRLPYPYTEESADWWYENAVSGDGKNGIFRAVAVDGEIVGSISIEPQYDIYIKDTEIGYMLLSEYHGKGIMTEAVRQICEIAFAALDIERITGKVCSPNLASQRVLLKNGFELEGIMKKAVYKDGHIADLHIYGKCRTGYGNLKADAQCRGRRTIPCETEIPLAHQTTEHSMQLFPASFEKIKNGTKTVELRLWDEKRQKIKVGDTVVFGNTESGETLKTTVLQLHRFDSFAALYQALLLLSCGYTEETLGAAHPSDMEAYYSASEQARYGVVGIELSL